MNPEVRVGRTRCPRTRCRHARQIVIAMACARMSSATMPSPDVQDSTDRCAGQNCTDAANLVARDVTSTRLSVT
jgi:hypothetical protein